MALAQTDSTKTNIIAPASAHNLATEEYASISPVTKFMSDNITLLIEGMPDLYTYDKELLNEKRKPMVFANMVEALNYMARLGGWQFVNTYNDGKGLHYLLKRPVAK
ncbi:hypothetical protein [Mucilaginibacter pedocola]|uniref:Uncharacterized protein n=1 Tax=Mucilaginibacter pedocola TaxID=1792845 RepID=A0A1S9PCI9_9SPHI|nr:hypothetical protein [Mucilaginibacter pedocola]OOQ58704.1 hypothetical protein BC343_08550 [Mucilaginibacter pedocola]